MAAPATVETWWAALRAQGVPVDPDQLADAVRVATVLDAAGQGERLFASVQGILTKNDRDLALLRAIAAGLFALLVVAAIGIRLVPPKQEATGNQIDIATENMADAETAPPPPAPTTGLTATIGPQAIAATTDRPPPAWARFADLAVVALPLLLVAGLLLWRRSRLPAWTRMAPDTAEDRLNNRLPAVDESGLFGGAALRSLARALTARSDEPSTTIDVRRTVEATAGHAGLLQIAWEPQLLDSPVHFAIERRSREDHVAELYFRVADALRAQGADVRVSQYRDDLGSRRDESGRPLGAQRPDPWESKALLVAVGEGDGLFGPTGRDPSPAQLRHVESWPQRALLSIRPVLLWGDREERLGEAAMAVAPATARGLGALADRLLSRQPMRGLLGVRPLARAPDAGSARLRGRDEPVAKRSPKRKRVAPIEGDPRSGV